MAKLSRKYDLLVSPIFVIGLIVLFLNDHYFKYAFSNWITGKLSDFVGLFLFGLFWIVIFPNRKIFVLSVIALGFVFWKSPLSNSLIWSVNNFSPITFQRIIDYSDLIALLVLPLSLLFYNQSTYRFVRLKPIQLIPALIVFSATSMIHPMVAEQDKLVNIRVEDYSYKINVPLEDYQCFLDNAYKYQDIFNSLSYFDKVFLQNDTLYLDYRFKVHLELDSIGTDYFYANAIFYEKNRTDKKVKLVLVSAEASVRHDNIKKDLKGLLSAVKHQIKNVIREYKN